MTDEKRTELDTFLTRVATQADRLTWSWVSQDIHMRTPDLIVPIPPVGCQRHIRAIVVEPRIIAAQPEPPVHLLRELVVELRAAGRVLFQAPASYLPPTREVVDSDTHPGLRIPALLLAGVPAQLTFRLFCSLPAHGLPFTLHVKYGVAP